MANESNAGLEDLYDIAEGKPEAEAPVEEIATEAAAEETPQESITEEAPVEDALAAETPESPAAETPAEAPAAAEPEYDLEGYKAAYEALLAQHQTLAQQLIQQQPTTPQAPAQPQQQMPFQPFGQPQQPQAPQWGAPAQQQQQQAQMLPLVDETTLEQVVTNPQAFNAVMTHVANMVMQRTMQEMTPIVDRYAAFNIDRAMTTREFMQANPDMKAVTPLFVQMANQKFHENPTQNLYEIYNSTAQEIRKLFPQRRQQQAPAAPLTPGVSPRRPGMAKPPGATRQPSAPPAKPGFMDDILADLIPKNDFYSS